MSVDPVLEATLELFEKNWTERENKIRGWWDYYIGKQAGYLPRFPDETDDDYTKRVETAYVENHTGLSVDIPVARIYGTPDGHSSVSRRAIDPAANEFLWDNIYENNDMLTLGIRLGTMMGATGNSIITLVPWDKTLNRVLKTSRPPDYIRKNATIKYRLLDTSQTLPLERSKEDLSLGTIIRWYLRPGASGISQVDQLRRRFGAKFKEVEVIEFIDDQNWYRWERSGDDDSGEFLLRPLEINSYKRVGQTVNPYGSVGMVFVVFKNIGLPTELDGSPDHRQILGLQDDLNENLTDSRAILRNHSFPIIKALKNAKLPKVIKFGMGRVWEFEGEGDAEILSWNGNLESSHQRAIDSRNMMALLSGTSLLSRGNSELIGQIRSQPALRVLFAPDVLRMALKIPFIIQAERELIKSTLMMWEWMLGFKPAVEPNRVFESYDSKVTVPEDIIGFDDLSQAQTEQIQLESGTERLEEILAEKHPELPESKIKALAETVKSTMKQQVKSPAQSSIEQ